MDRRIQKRFRISKQGQPRQQLRRRRLKLGTHRYTRCQPNRVMDLVARSGVRRSDKDRALSGRDNSGLTPLAPAEQTLRGGR